MHFLKLLSSLFDTEILILHNLIAHNIMQRIPLVIINLNFSYKHLLHIINGKYVLYFLVPALHIIEVQLDKNTEEKSMIFRFRNAELQEYH